MALSNLRNEPRREIIEQAVGVIFLAAFLVLDYAAVKWLGAKEPGDFLIGMPFVGAGLFFASFFLAFGVHAIGEFVCAGMASLGFDPRPKRTR